MLRFPGRAPLRFVRRASSGGPALRTSERGVVEVVDAVEALLPLEQPQAPALDLGLHLLEPAQRTVEVVGRERGLEFDVGVLVEPGLDAELAGGVEHAVRDHGEGGALEVVAEPPVRGEALEEALQTEVPPEVLEDVGRAVDPVFPLPERRLPRHGNRRLVLSTELPRERTRRSTAAGRVARAGRGCAPRAALAFPYHRGRPRPVPRTRRCGPGS